MLKEHERELGSTPLFLLEKKLRDNVGNVGDAGRLVHKSTLVDLRVLVHARQSRNVTLEDLYILVHNPVLVVTAKMVHAETMDVFGILVSTPKVDDVSRTAHVCILGVAASMMRDCALDA